MAVPRSRSVGSLAAICGLLLAVTATAQQSPSASPSDDLLQQGRTALAAGKYQDAIKFFRDGNKLQHNSCFECNLGLATAYSRMNDFQGAQENSKKALALASDANQRARAHTALGSALMRFAGGDPKKLVAAEAEFRQALAQNKDDPAAQFHLGVVLLKQKRDEEGKAELATCLELAPSGPYAEQAKKVLADPRRARERFAPEFQVTTLQGESLSLSGLAGRFVVLDFWATWCPPCRASVPELKELTKKYPQDRLVLISISADHDDKAWREFVAKRNMDWAQFRDADQRMANAFGVRAFPTYLVIDGDGIVQQEIVGENPQQSVVYRLRDILKSFKQLNAER